jgi:OmpA-OmpF porin, OOP family
MGIFLINVIIPKKNLLTAKEKTKKNVTHQKYPPVKKLLLAFGSSIALAYVFAQPAIDTTVKLVEQKNNIITDQTILKIENLGLRINTEVPELRPTISADGQLLFFIRQNDPQNTTYGQVPNSQDIWFSEKDTLTGKWSEAVHLGYPLNTYYYNAVFWISPDNNRILIRNAFINGDYAGNGVSMCYLKKDGYWSKPHALIIKNMTQYNRGRQYGATMANNGRALLFYMTPEEEGYNNDLYVSFPEQDGTWTEPKNLGKIINGKNSNETTPYLAPDGVTLYFSSSRPGGFGYNDIWMAKRLDDTWQKWSTPVNLGEPINTPEIESFFTMDAGGEYAYMSTAQDSYGESDIVRIKLLEKEKPNPVILVHGNVYNKKTGKPLSANLIYETLPDGLMAGEGISNAGDGAFKMVLPYNKNYSIHAQANHFFAISENLNLDSFVKAGYKEIHKDLYMVPIEIGSVVRLNNVFFDFDKWGLRPESFVELDRVVKLLKENPGIEIEMSAHTDSRGSDEYNLKLSDNRARSVMEYLVSQGIAQSRVVSHGYGENKPVAPGNSEENHQLNRRVEFTILKD